MTGISAFTLQKILDLRKIVRNVILNTQNFAKKNYANWLKKYDNFFLVIYYRIKIVRFFHNISSSRYLLTIALLCVTRCIDRVLQWAFSNARKDDIPVIFSYETSEQGWTLTGVNESDGSERQCQFDRRQESTPTYQWTISDVRPVYQLHSDKRIPFSLVQILRNSCAACRPCVSER